MRPKVILEWFLVAIGLIAMAFALEPVIAGDGMVRFEALTQLLEQGTFSKTFYSMIGPVFSAPLWYLGKGIASSYWWCARYNGFIFVIGMLLTLRKFHLFKNPDLGRRLVLALLAMSMFPFHLRNFYGEPFTAILVALGFLSVAHGRIWFGMFLAALGSANTPATLVGLALVSATLCWQEKRFRFLLPFVFGVSLVLLENWIRRGNPLVMGYLETASLGGIDPYSGKQGFSYPFMLGLLSILFSFGRGLVYFCPGLLLDPRASSSYRSKEIQRFYVLSIAFLAGLILAYSKWWSWYGGEYWGPRFFLFASIPASLALVIRLQAPEKSGLGSNLFVFLVLALSTWVGFNAITGHQVEVPVCKENSYYLHTLCRYVPEFSALWHPLLDESVIWRTNIPAMILCGLSFWVLGEALMRVLARQLSAAISGALQHEIQKGKWRF